MADMVDAEVRLRAFQFLEEASARFPGPLPRDLLVGGFEMAGRRVPLMGPQGIFKPAVISEMPLSITTAPIVEGRSPRYDDAHGPDEVLRYRYRGDDPQHHENVGLRLAMRHRAPLIYFYGVERGWYLAEWPVFIVGDDPANLTFMVEFGERQDVGRPATVDQVAERARAYRSVTIQARLHQQSFRHRVLHAYMHSCAVCRLKRAELLDAAHIVPDRDPRGEPWVSNGLALCKLHHAAFETNILGIRPDLTMEVRADVLRDEDGPMLVHGIQHCHGQKLVVVPRAASLKPRPEFLEMRYQEFQSAG